MPARTYYQHNIKEYLKELDTNKERRSLIVLLRLISFVGIIVSVYYFFQLKTTILGAVVLLAIILFGWLVRKAAELNTQRLFLEKLLFVNRNEIEVLDYSPNRFPDGQEFLDFDTYLYDLDIFGPASIFHLLNRTTTTHGKEFLANELQHPELNLRKIQENQSGIETLASQPDIRQEIVALGLATEEDGTLYNISQWVRSPSVVSKKKWINFLRYILPVISISAFLYYLSTDNYGPLIIAIIITWIIIILHTRLITEQHTLLSKKQKILEQYAHILKAFHKVDSRNSELLKRLTNSASEAHHEIRSLSKLTGLFDQRINMVVNIFLNSFLMYDIHLIISLENWKQRNAARFETWIQAVGQIESLVSFATFAYNHNAYVFPEILASTEPVLEVEALGHPLLKEEEMVFNDLHPQSQAKVFLITGSNMSGKTTFLRSIGVNILLASCGAPVCAKKFRFTPMNILTSIRISDSLQEHTSYFMAELKRLSSIISHLEDNQKSIVLIDEILRGTNSDDKTHGSAGYIKKLMKYNCISFFATHDLALSELENGFPANIRNYCFESTIDNGELYFDYKLREGVAKNKNASFLMEKMGII